jgi:hypothetical protein
MIDLKKRMFGSVLQMYNSLLCWPVLNPQMIGDPSDPGEVSEKLSVVQSPKEEPVKK